MADQATFVYAFIPYGRFQIVSFFLVKRVTTLPTVVFPTQDLNRTQDVRKNKTSRRTMTLPASSCTAEIGFILDVMHLLCNTQVTVVILIMLNQVISITVAEQRH